MSAITENLRTLLDEMDGKATLIAVSKTKPEEDILEAYNAGQRVFGENKVQEMSSKYENLPKDIEWHLIGHLQTNKVKYIASFVSLIHSVDSLRLLQEIDKQGKKNNRVIPCLLQVHVAMEETKFGLSAEEVEALLHAPAFSSLANISIKGLMGMATNTHDAGTVRNEFRGLKKLFDKLKQDFPGFEVLSMGMTSDYTIAMEEGSTHVRIGSAIFGGR